MTQGVVQSGEVCRPELPPFKERVQLSRLLELLKSSRKIRPAPVP